MLETEPLEKRLDDARRNGSLEAADPEAELVAAEDAELITAEDAARLREARERVAEIIAVDDFEAGELRAGKSSRDRASRQVA